MPSRAFLRALPLLLALLLAAFAAPAQDPTPIRAEIEGWDRILGMAERFARGGVDDPREAQRVRAQLRNIDEDAVALRQSIERNLRAAQDLLKSLGPAPKESEPPESKAVADRRAKFEANIARLQSQKALVDLAIKRAGELNQAVASGQRSRLIERILEPYPLPIAPDTVATAVPQFLSILATIAKSPVEWLAQLVEQKRQRTALWRGLLIVVVAIAVSAFVRRFVVRRFGRRPDIEQPSYARRVLGAVAEGIATGIVPAAILGGVYLFVARDGTLITGTFNDVARSALAAMFVFVLVTAMTRAVLAPGLPAWRITEFDSESGRIIYRRVFVLAAVFCVDLFFDLSTRAATLSTDLWSAYHAVVTVLEALVLLALVPGRLWRAAPGGPSDATDKPPTPPVSAFWGWVRRIVAAVAVIGIVATLAGYVGLGRYLVENTLYTGLVLGGFGIARGLVGDVIDVGAESAFMQEKLGIGAATLQRWRFWLRAAIDPVLFVLCFAIVASYWGLPREDLIGGAVSLVRGFKIGNVTFSPADIAMAIIVFLLAMAGTRLLQRLLVDKLLPETRMERGAQHSLAAGVGYIGVVVAAALAVGVAGVDLTNIALVAGALSVGIGFGLQNIVNNFVSGLILLVERPINVGDWVVIGGKEGTIKRINFRATEMETFQRASVIIPNAEILSSSVVNWTLKDRMGRIEIKVGVAYGSDTELVKTALLDVAKAHPNVLSYPPAMVLFQNFGDSSLDFELRCFTGNVMERMFTESDLRFAIDARFRKDSIDIPFPQRVVHFAPGHGPAWPNPHDGAAGKSLGQVEPTEKK